MGCCPLDDNSYVSGYKVLLQVLILLIIENKLRRALKDDFIGVGENNKTGKLESSETMRKREMEKKKMLSFLS